MKLKTLSAAMILATVPMTGAFAAAMDRSGQSIAAFLQPGNYFEAGISVLDPDVSGKVRSGYTPNAAVPSNAVGLENTNVGDMADDYYFPSAALKFQVTDNFSVGLLYDQPFGAEATYSARTPVATSPFAGPFRGEGAFHDGKGNATSVEVKTQNIALVFGYQPTENWNFYAGPVYQEVKGDVELYGLAYGGAANGFGGYKAHIGKNEDYGWLAGVAYQIPEIALKASLTYRSEIEHKVRIKESSSGAIGPYINNPALLGSKSSADTDITTPQSVNLDFQTGIMEDTVAFLNVRWVNWEDFSIRPYAFGQVAEKVAGPRVGKKNGFDLVAYKDDQWSATLGVGRKFTPKWAGNVSVGYDTGAGDPVTTLGPTEGYWSLGIGGQYSPEENYFIQAGVKYFWLGDAKAQSGADFGTKNYVAEFKDNHAIGYGLKFGYKF